MGPDFFDRQLVFVGAEYGFNADSLSTPEAALQFQLDHFGCLEESLAASIFRRICEADMTEAYQEIAREVVWIEKPHAGEQVQYGISLRERG
ncbi:MAG: hypothetical protein ACREUU_11315, partial [Gammaproteobacteria bacterium]